MRQYAKWIGIPYDQLNCWDLFREVQKEINGHNIPKIQVPEGDDDKGILTESHEERKRWAPTVDPKLGDAVLMGRGKVATHIGVYMGANQVLHTTEKHGSCISDVRHFGIMGINILGYFWRVEE